MQALTSRQTCGFKGTSNKKKEDISVKESKEGCVRRFGGRKGKGEMIKSLKKKKIKRSFKSWESPHQNYKSNKQFLGKWGSIRSEVQVGHRASNKRPSWGVIRPREACQSCGYFERTAMQLGLHTVPEGIAINSLGQEKSGLVGNHLFGVPDVLWGDPVFIRISLGK